MYSNPNLGLNLIYSLISMPFKADKQKKVAK